MVEIVKVFHYPCYGTNYLFFGMRYVVEACGTTNNSQIYAAVFVGTSANCSNLKCVVSGLSPCSGNPLIYDTTTYDEQYYLFVSSTEAENITLRVLSTTPIDVCNDAIPYPLGLRVIVDTRDVSKTSLAQNCYLQSIFGPGVWYKVTGTGRNITAQPLIKRLETSIGIYTGTCGADYNALQCIAVNNKQCFELLCEFGRRFSDEPIVEFASVRGTTYYINVVTAKSGLTPILIRSECGLLGLQSIFCPLTFNGIVGRLFRRLFYEIGKLTGKN
jgi:hypothetical protein